VPATPREGFVVRILAGASETSAGLGFVVGERHIITCAHVVNVALSRDKGSAERPPEDARLHIDFPLLGDLEGAPLRRCKIVAWEPPPAGDRAGLDLAGLTLVGAEGLPVGAGPARLLDVDDRYAEPVSVFGFPGDPPRRQNGGWSSCSLRGVVGSGLLQLDMSDGSALRAQPGYSGTPVVVADERGDAVIGMFAVAGRAANVRDSYAVRLAQLSPAWPQILARRIPPRCPYRGLHAFTSVDADAGLFVGREDEVGRLRRMTQRQPFVLVVGSSGVGKSSLVGAGLVPALARDGWAVAWMRPGNSPFDSLARALLDLEGSSGGYSLKDLNETAERLRREGPWRIANQLSLLLNKRVALVIDQLEEALAVENTVQGVDFLDKVLPAAAPDSGDGEVRVIGTLRVDFLPALIEVPEFGSRLQDRQLNLSPLGVPAMTRVIKEPAALHGVHYAPGLAETIAQEASHGRGGLPLLEFALTELWEFQQDRRLSFDNYHMVGGVAGTLNRHAERIYHGLTETVDPARIRRVLLAMVRTRGGAGQAVRATARKEYLGTDWTIAEQLAHPAHRLVVLGPDGPGTAEIAHEALIREWSRLSQWVDEDAAFQRWLAIMEERALDGDLLSDARVAEAQRWLTERAGDIPETVADLVARSRSAMRQRIDDLESARLRAEAALGESQQLTARLEQANQDLIEESRYKSEFMANMSHELRTPLNSLLILARLLADNPGQNLTGKQIEFARTIHSAGSDLLSLINDILDLARIEADRMNIESEEVGLERVRSYIEQAFGPLAQEKGLDLRIDIADNLPASIVTDEHRLQQILRNLLSNAIKFTDAGSVSLGISWAARHPGMVTFVVEDTGIGIAQDKLEMIFEPFRQADGTTTRQYGGTGLGLSISRQLADLMGGSITVSSTPAQGSAFTLRLPAGVRPSTDFIARTADDATAETGPLGVDPEVLQRLAGVSVLVVDDDVRNVFALTSALEQLGMHVLYSDNGADGIRLLKEHPEIDIVLMDAMMPGQDGYETTRQIRQDQRFQHLPVIFFTARAMPGDRERALGAGGNDHLTKPAEPSDLCALMAQYLDHAGQTADLRAD